MIKNKIKIRLSKKLFIIIFAILMLIVVGLQLAYPSDRNLPRAKLFDQSVGMDNFDKTKLLINDQFEEKMISINLSSTDKKTELSLRTLGANVNDDLMAKSLSDYPVIQRFIPFSVLIKKPEINKYNVFFIAEIRDQAINEILPELTNEAKDAKLYIENNEVKIEPSQNGYSSSLDDVINALNSINYNQEFTSIEVDPEPVIPKVTESDLEQSYQKAVTYSKNTISINGKDNAKYVISPEAIIAMITIDKNQDNEISITIDEAKLADHIKNAGNQFYVAPVPDQVGLLDGEETNRKSGKPGETINTTELKEKILIALESESLNNELSASFIEIPAGEVFNRTYSKSQKGLQAYLNRLSKTDNVRVSIKQITGTGWVANTRHTESTVSASTYKLFIALMVLDKVDKGELSLSDSFLGTNVNGCLEKMIVISDNPCAEAWIDQFGRQQINDFLYGQGVSSATSFTNPLANHTSSKDLIFILEKINNGSLLSSGSKNNLLDKMARQQWRKGIPSGTSGNTFNKVGYIWSYTHDTGIINHPSGSYILAIMTKGSNFARIAEITRELESIMY